MLPLSPITDTAESVFLTCIQRISDAGLRNRLTSIKNDVIQHDKSLLAAGAAATYFKLSAHNSVGGAVTRDELIDVYDSQMVPRKSRGRVVYDRIMALPKHSRCPLCGLGRVASLDHYMPKTGFPGLAVCPRNLLPACSDCNKKKHSAVPHCASQQTLHPYFDNVDDVIWLQARFQKRTPVVVRFYVEKPKAWTRITAMRVRYHFTSFNLAQIYSSEATSELEGIKAHLASLLQSCGPSGVNAHLAEQAKSRTAAGKNSWKAALYRALAASTWFCHTGCKG